MSGPKGIVVNARLALFLWNAFPELSLDMTSEANCKGAFSKHLRFGFGILEFEVLT